MIKQPSVSYKFTYLGRHATANLLVQHVQYVTQDQIMDYTRHIGIYLYEFQVSQCKRFENKQPEIIPMWRVLKTAQQYKKHIVNAHLTDKIHTIKHANFMDKFQSTPFQLTNLEHDLSYPVPRNLRKFFQLYNTDVKKVTSLRMKVKLRGLTYAKKMANFFCGVQWQPKKIFVTQFGILQISENGLVTDFLKFDLFFSIQVGSQITSHQFGVALLSAQRKIVLRAYSAQDFLKFLYYTKKAIDKYCQGIHYSGSSRSSSNNKIDFIIDAEQYYQQVYRQLMRAKQTVYICGWWVSPELYLLRPSTEDDSTRLDKVLQVVANKGVKIYIVVFFSPSVIPNDSEYTKKRLSQIHPTNIIVERHPHQILPKLWSHHEKAVIIDQRVALMGGLDLCYGRYDDCTHPVHQNDQKKYPFLDYNNVRIKDFFEVKNYRNQLMTRDMPRMPWHDIAYKVSGGNFVADAANHFIQYWNFTILQKRIAPIVASTEKDRVQQTKQVVGSQVQKNINNIILAILKLAISQNKEMSQVQKQVMFDHLDKKQFEKIMQKKERKWRIANKFQLNNGSGEDSLVLSIKAMGLIRSNDPQRQTIQKQNFVDTLQLLRSASEWSIGLQQGTIQRSIQNAYLSLISNSKSYIYIQNQFFISATDQNKKSYVQNQIANALFDRIRRAHVKHQPFFVVVFMPLLPGMQGQLSQKCPLSLKLTLHWQFNTISRVQQSLLQRIQKQLGVKSDRYIKFFSLRNHGKIKYKSQNTDAYKPVTQLIYIHSKLMIVDDDIVLCGSANINDRSQCGDRDSQLAVLFTDGHKVQKRMHYQINKVNEKAHRLRSNLYKEHFNFSDYQAQDPLNGNTIDKMMRIAQRNTLTYRKIFRCLPDDEIKKFSQIKQWQSTQSQSIKLYDQQCSNIVGHAVEFPTQFLRDQKLYRFDVDMVQDIFT